MNKTCITCKQEKNINLYSNDSSRKDGKRPECKVCKSLRDKLYKLANKDKVKEREKKYYQEHKDEIKEKTKLWYEENKEKAKETRALYYQNNKQKMDNAKKIWYEKNKEKMKLWVNEYMKNRYQTNFDYRIKTIMNKRIRDYIRSKTQPTLEFLGCSIDDFKKWIEYQFDKNMSWDNMGTYWSFDHVVPCASFDFSKEEDILECYNWTNLRPLKATDNSSKGSKIEEDLIDNHKLLLAKYIEEKL